METTAQCTDSNQILHSDKDHRTLFVGGPRHLKKWKIDRILATVRLISMKFDA